MRDVKDSTVLITGGGSGIGAGVARLFTSLGASVVIAGRREDKINAVADELGGRCLVVCSDVTDGDDRRNLVARTLTRRQTARTSMEVARSAMNPSARKACRHR